MIMLKLTPSNRFETMGEASLGALLFYTNAFMPSREQIQAERERKAEEGLKNMLRDILMLDQLDKSISDLESSMGIESRVYPTRMFKMTGETLYNSFDDLKKYGEEVGYESEEFALMQKSLLKEVREILNTDCVLGYVYEEASDKKEVVLFEFPVIATENNRYMPQYDQEMQSPYITV